jgi:phenylpropionate dioxygenase-like ring-hydroxylating dioxygenase large terminal subunit
VAAEANGQKLVVVRFGSGAAKVFHRFFPHLGANLVRFGVVKGETLHCQSHHWAYDCDGLCIAATGEDPLPDERLVAHPTGEENGAISVRLDSPQSPSSKPSPSDKPEAWLRPGAQIVLQCRPTETAA